MAIYPLVYLYVRCIYTKKKNPSRGDSLQHTCIFSLSLMKINNSKGIVGMMAEDKTKHKSSKKKSQDSNESSSSISSTTDKLQASVDKLLKHQKTLIKAFTKFREESETASGESNNNIARLEESDDDAPRSSTAIFDGNEFLESHSGIGDELSDGAESLDSNYLANSKANSTQITRPAKSKKEFPFEYPKLQAPNIESIKKLWKKYSEYMENYNQAKKATSEFKLVPVNISARLDFISDALVRRTFKFKKHETITNEEFIERGRVYMQRYYPSSEIKPDQMLQLFETFPRKSTMAGTFHGVLQQLGRQHYTFNDIVGSSPANARLEHFRLSVFMTFMSLVRQEHRVRFQQAADSDIAEPINQILKALDPPGQLTDLGNASWSTVLILKRKPEKPFGQPQDKESFSQRHHHSHKGSRDFPPRNSYHKQSKRSFQNKKLPKCRIPGCDDYHWNKDCPKNKYRNNSNSSGTSRNLETRTFAYGNNKKRFKPNPNREQKTVAIVTKAHSHRDE